MPNQSLKFVVLAFVGLMLSGCMTFEVASNASEPETSENNKQTVHGSMYGFKWQKYHIQKCKDTTLAKVEYHYNFLQLSATVLSLGLWVPQSVEWWCDEPSQKDDENEPEPDPNNEFGAELGGHGEGGVS